MHVKTICCTVWRNRKNGRAEQNTHTHTRTHDGTVWCPVRVCVEGGKGLLCVRGHANGNAPRSARVVHCAPVG
jgi:hypothetical protein